VSLGLTDRSEKEEGIPFSGMHPRPYIEISKQDVLAEIKRMGFASDWHPVQKDLEKYAGERLLLLFDPERVYGEKFVWANTAESYERETLRIEEVRKREVAKYFAQFDEVAEQEQLEEAEENIVVRDLPRTCGEWRSETMEATHAEVSNFSVMNLRPLMKVMISRPRAAFGKASKFSDSGENCPYVRPMKDPTHFAVKRTELELGIQAVKETTEATCQTTWNRPVNKSTQYSPMHFLEKEKYLGSDQVEALSRFLQCVSVRVEEALQTNETVDIFQEEFANLGEDAAISKTSSSLKEFRNFHDVEYTKGKRIEWVEWVPGSTDMLACSCCENAPFYEKLESAGRATVSTILLWSFQDALSPHCKLLSPFEVPVFKFYPTNEHYLIGGLSSGQMAVWKLSDADMGLTSHEKSKGSHDEERRDTIPCVLHKVASVIDDSHRRPVMAIEWLPPALEVERRGKTSEKNPKDGPVKYLVTISIDGQLMIWDFQKLLDQINDHDFGWKPEHRIQLQRQDSGTEMGCCHVLYCPDRYEKGVKQVTNFYASTEEGELLFGDWAARVEEDQKPQFCKRMFTVSKTFRPMLSLERSPFFPEILLGVTDWAFYLWKDGLKEHLFQSAAMSYFTRGVWSPTRPCVVFLGVVTGGIDIWDFSDQSHKASLSDTWGFSCAIASMVFSKGAEEQMLAAGDAQGHLHVHTIPKNLSKPAPKEVQTMQRFLEREEQRVVYFEQRQQELAELKEQLEKQAQMQADKEEPDKDKMLTDDERFDVAAEEEYLRLQADCVEILKAGGAVT